MSSIRSFLAGNVSPSTFLGQDYELRYWCTRQSGNQVFIVVVSHKRQRKFIGDVANWVKGPMRDVLPCFYATYSHLMNRVCLREALF